MEQVPPSPSTLDRSSTRSPELQAAIAAANAAIRAASAFQNPHFKGANIDYRASNDPFRPSTRTH